MSENVICTGCGRLGAPPEPPYLSCCPERNPVPVDSAAGIESARISAEAEEPEKFPNGCEVALIFMTAECRLSTSGYAEPSARDLGKCTKLVQAGMAEENGSGAFRPTAKGIAALHAAVI